MRIAILCWGSLWWKRGEPGREIKLSPEWQDGVTPGPWNDDGPVLPVEFARVSSDGRLTLVLHPNSPGIRTYWAISWFGQLCDARENLRFREGKNCSPNNIHSITSDGKMCVEIPMEFTAARQAIADWLGHHQDINAAIWTGLPCKWMEGQTFSVGAAIDYLKSLVDDPKDKYPNKRSRACEYFTKSPPQTQTPVRQKAREVLGWSDDLPSNKSASGGATSPAR